MNSRESAALPLFFHMAVMIFPLQSFAGIYSQLETVFKAVFVVCAMVSAVNICIRISHADQDGVRQLMKWMGVLIGGFLAFAVIKTVSGGMSGYGGTSVAAVTRFKTELGGTLKFILGISSLCSLTVMVIQMMRRDREAVRKVVFWTVGFVIGYLLINTLMSLSV